LYGPELLLCPIARRQRHRHDFILASFVPTACHRSSVTGLAQSYGPGGGTFGEMWVMVSYLFRRAALLS
jgi:hypothetical protein